MGASNLISAETIAHNLRDSFAEDGIESFTARPWNIYKPVSTLWWLVPSTEWPAYKHGKLFINRLNEKCRIGMNIEKGLLKFDRRAGFKQTRVMEADWVWHDFITDLKSSSFERHLQSISNGIGLPFRITVSEANVEKANHRDMDDIGGYEDDHFIAFVYSSGSLKCIKDETKGTLFEYEKLTEISQLTTIFDNNELDWLWVDLNVAFELDADQFYRVHECALAFIKEFPDLFK